jgi:hypothetical protein
MDNNYGNNEKGILATGKEDPVIFFVYRDSHFDKALLDLKAQGGTAALIAEKAEAMIEDLLKGKRTLRQLGKQTRNGEYRIGQCFKFDMGGGYRMACLRLNEYLVLLYIGSHDDCCRRIEHMKGMKYEISDRSRAVPVVRMEMAAKAIPEDIEEELRHVAAYEESLMSRIDDNILRRIFLGFVRKD